MIGLNVRSRDIRDESGASLIVVLMFISVFGLIIASLITEAGASVKYTDTVSNHERKVYAADAGVSFGIQQLQQKDQICPTNGSNQTIQVVAVPSGPGQPPLNAQVNCQVTSGSVEDGSGYAIYTKSPASDSLTLQSGQPKDVTGSVYVTGMVNGLSSTGMIVEQGTFGQHKGDGCTTQPPATDLKLDPGYNWSCGTAVPVDPAHVAPARPTSQPWTFADGVKTSGSPTITSSTASFGSSDIGHGITGAGIPANTTIAAVTSATQVTMSANATASGTGITIQRDHRSATTSGACTIFYPGLYTSPPAWAGTSASPGSLGSGTNYFASGVYYFNFAGAFNIDKVVYGGEKATFEDLQYPSKPSCASDATAKSAAGGSAPEVSGTGVEFVFGGGAAMKAANGSQVELFNRTLDGTVATINPTVVGVPPADGTSDWPAAGWTQNPSGTWVVDLANGSNPNLVVHGLVYAPADNVRLWSTNGVDAAVLGGIVAWKAEIQSSNGGGGGGIAIRASNGNPDPRHIVVSATAPYPAPASGEKQVVSTAVVEIANYARSTIAAASNGVNVSTFTGSGTLTVASTANFPAKGTVSVATASGFQQVTYTGIGSGTTLTGCNSNGGSGVMSTGGAVFARDRTVTIDSWRTRGVTDAL